MSSVDDSTPPDLVHAVSYSLLLLNTDLHVADLATRMSRSQFVKNTLTAIQTQIQPSTFPTQKSFSDLTETSSVRVNSENHSTTDSPMRSKRSDSITSWNSVREGILISSASAPAPQMSSPGHHANDSTPSISASARESQKLPAYGRTWEIDMENLLKVGYRDFSPQQMSLISFPGNVQCYQKPANSPASKCWPKLNDS